MRAFMVVGTAAVVLAAAACKGSDRVETKEVAPATEPAPTESGSSVEVRTGNDTINADTTGVRVKVNTDS